MKRISRSYSTTPAHLVVVAAFVGTSVFASSVLAVDSGDATPTIMQCEEKIPEGARWRMSIERDTDEGTLSATLVDTTKPDSPEVPEGSGAYLQCLYSAVGIPEEHLPEVVSTSSR